MIADVVHPITLAGAFVLGAVLATVAVLRVIRAVSRIFEETDRRRRRRWEDE